MMVLLARLLLGAACALAAPAAHARSWVMTPDPADTTGINRGVSFSAVDLPPEVTGLVNEQQSLSVHFLYISYCQDCESAVHFDQPASRAWAQLDPPCFFGVRELGPGETGTRNVAGQLIYFDSIIYSESTNCTGADRTSGIVTYEFSVLPSQVDFYVWRSYVREPGEPITDSSTVSATVEVAALAPTLGSLGMALLAAGFVLATLVAARPTGWPS